MSSPYAVRAPKRAVNLSLNEDLVRRARGLTPNLSEQVERLLAEWLVAETARRTEADRALDRTVEAWNDFERDHGSLSDEHSPY